MTYYVSSGTLNLTKPLGVTYYYVHLLCLCKKISFKSLYIWKVHFWSVGTSRGDGGYMWIPIPVVKSLLSHYLGKGHDVVVSTGESEQTRWKVKFSTTRDTTTSEWWRLSKWVFYRVESSSRRHWPTLTRVLWTVSMEFCIKQQSVVMGEVLAACF